MNAFLSLERRAQQILETPGGFPALVAYMTEPFTEVVDSEANRASLSLRRMTAIALLEIFASRAGFSWEVADAASEALAEIVRRPIDQHVPIQIKRMLVGEIRDALAAIVRIDPIKGVQLLQEFSRAQRQFLDASVVLGLVDTGVPLDQAQRYVSTIPD